MGVRGPAIGPTLATLSFHLKHLSLHSRTTAAAFSSGFLFNYIRHLCIPAADLVPAADGLGLRVR